MPEPSDMTYPQSLPVINLMGPTASGKTAIACQLYERGGVELISVDSALIFRGMDIGTAKPTATELERYPHYLIDICPPTAVYSAAQFVNDANRLIDDIHARGHVPVLVGGTMLYFKSLLEGLSDHLPAADATVRVQIELQAAQEGWAAIHAELSLVDPVAGQKFGITDRQRLIRALEVYRLTGQPISTLQAAQIRQPPRHHFINMALMPERGWLHDRIAQRLELMWQHGLVDEVIGLLQRYPTLRPDLPAMRTVGYRQVIDYLAWCNQHPQASSSEVDQQFAEMKLKALYATRQLAKRQYTWLRSLQHDHYFQCYNDPQQALLDLRNVVCPA